MSLQKKFKKKVPDRLHAVRDLDNPTIGHLLYSRNVLNIAAQRQEELLHMLHCLRGTPVHLTPQLVSGIPIVRLLVALTATAAPITNRYRRAALRRTLPPERRAT